MLMAMDRLMFVARSPHIAGPATFRPRSAYLKLQMPKPSYTMKHHTFSIKSPIVLCSQQFAWEPSPVSDTPTRNSDALVKGSNIFDILDVEDKTETAISDADDATKEGRDPSQLFKWPMWVLGPFLLLTTGMVPTLWLPLSSVFSGCNISGLLSLVGLDCIFNIGATLFLLMADASARSNHSHNSSRKIPGNYRIWNTVASVVGFMVPLMILVASQRSMLKPQLPFLSFTVLFGPYLLLLFMQMLTEMLTWHWRSPVWLITPVVYQAYRVLQLMRCLRLGTEVGASPWVVESTRVLVCWWVLILGVQLMRVSWFSGFGTKEDDAEA